MRKFEFLNIRENIRTYTYIINQSTGVNQELRVYQLWVNFRD